MTQGPFHPKPDLSEVRVLLCDADGCLFPSEEPAFEDSTAVSNALLAELGVEKRFTPAELRSAAVGKNFRATAIELAEAFDVPLDAALAAGRAGARVAREDDPIVLRAEELERWAAVERREVSAHLRDVLTPDPDVRDPLGDLARRYDLAVVSSSALARLGACFDACGLAELFPPEACFSAEDSLPVPTSKPDPAIYALAGERLGVAGGQALAVEDSVAGVRSAVAAGFPTIANTVFVPRDEREARVAALGEAGAAATVSSWWELQALLESAPPMTASTPGAAGPPKPPA